MSSTPGEIRWLGEGIGAQNEEIFRDLLGIHDDDLKQMRDEAANQFPRENNLQHYRKRHYIRRQRSEETSRSWCR